MQRIPAEVTTMIRAFSLFWMFAVLAILIAGQWWQPAHEFRDKMLREWKPSLVIALLHALGTGIGGMGFFQLSSIAKFCQAMIGLALAYSIVGYEPLPVTQVVIHEEKRTKSIGNMLGAAATVVIAAFCQRTFRECAACARVDRHSSLRRKTYARFAQREMTLTLDSASSNPFDQCALHEEVEHQ